MEKCHTELIPQQLQIVRTNSSWKNYFGTYHALMKNVQATQTYNKRSETSMKVNM